MVLRGQASYRGQVQPEGMSIELRGLHDCRQPVAHGRQRNSGKWEYLDTGECPGKVLSDGALVWAA